MLYLSAQPDNIYFTWQLEVQFLNFKELNISLESYHVLVGIKEEVSESFLSLQSRYPEVKFTFIKDTRVSRRYIPSIRPHIISKYFILKPELTLEQIFYFDADVIFREQLNFSNFNSIDLVSNTDSYLGIEYIRSKGGEELLEEMCKILEVQTKEVKELGKHGGAQYFFQPGLTSGFWEKVERNSNELYNFLQNNTHIYAQKWSIEHKKPIKSYHEIQSWCSDMWCVLWNLLYFKRSVSVNEELDFSWGTSLSQDFFKHKIFHNAGVTENRSKELFYKGAFIRGLPENLDTSYVSDKFASFYYCKYVQQLVEEKKKKY